MKQINEEVFFPDQKIVRVNRIEINALQKQSLVAKRRRSRLCAHRDVSDCLHELLIVHPENTYVRPHKHLGKPESFHIITGTLSVIIFDEDGNITEIIPMGDYSSGQNFYYRISDPLYHTVMITSKIAIFHESTTGPFKRSDTVFAPWSPKEKDLHGVKMFMKRFADLQTF